MFAHSLHLCVRARVCLYVCVCECVSAVLPIASWVTFVVIANKNLPCLGKKLLSTYTPCGMNKQVAINVALPIPPLYVDALTSPAQSAKTRKKKTKTYGKPKSLCFKKNELYRTNLSVTNKYQCNTTN